MEENNIVRDSSGVLKPKGLSFEDRLSLAIKEKEPLKSELGSFQNPDKRAYFGDYFKDESRYDDELYNLDRLEEEGYSVNNLRGEALPWYDLIGAGIAKGTVLAGTTFADGAVGSIAGALNVLANALKIAESDDPLRELGNQFVNNPFSVAMLKINDSMESVLPNYYTKNEEEQPWWENIFTANFLGDKFLKNTGFMIGAAYSGKLYAGLLSKAMGLGAVRNAFKGTVTTASGKVLNSASEIAKAYKSGDAFMDGVKLTEDLAKSAKKLKDAEWKLKTIGAVNAAMGEGRIEAISNSKEFFDYNKSLLDDDRELKINSLEDELYEEHPEWFTLLELNGYLARVLISPEGKKEWENRKIKIESNYNSAIEKLSKDRASMANKIFAMNVALLSSTNLWEYSRFLSGGYNSGRLANGLIKGNKQTGYRLSKAARAKKLAKSLSVPFAEALEEMSQSMFSEITGQKYGSELNEFYGAKINPDSEEETINWLDAIAKGFDNTYGNATAWEEGFIGGLTGMLGIPKISMSKNDKGKNRPKISLNGELYEGLKEYKEDSKLAKSLIEALNKRIQDPDFLNYYQGAIRHNKFLNDMLEALNEGDSFSYKNAEDSLLISDAIMFEKAGRIQDLYDEMDEAANVSDDDVKEIRESTIDKESGKSIFDGRTDEEVKEHVKKLVEDAKRKTDSFLNIARDLKTLYGEDLTSDFLQEMTWTMSQINNIESRTKDVMQTLREIFTEKAEEIKSTYGDKIDIDLTNIDDFVKNFSQDKNLLREINQIMIDKYDAKERIKTLIQEKLNQLIQEKDELHNNILTLQEDFLKRRELLEKDREGILLEMYKLEDSASDLEKSKQDKKRAIDDYKLLTIDKLKPFLKHLEQLEKQYAKEVKKKKGGRSKVKDILFNIDKVKEDIDKIKREIKKVQDAEDLKLLNIDNELKEVNDKLKELTDKFNSEPYSKEKENKRIRLMLGETDEIISLFDETIAGLKAQKNELDGKAKINPLDSLKIGDLLVDLTRLIAIRDKFIDKYTLLSKNPNLFTESVALILLEKTKEMEKAEKDGIKERLEKCETTDDIKKLSEAYEWDIFEKTLKGYLKSENKELSEIVSKFLNWKDTVKVLYDIINGLDDTESRVSASYIMKDAELNSSDTDTLYSILDPKINKDIPEPIVAAMTNIVEKAKQQLKSEKTKEPDKSKKEKKSSLQNWKEKAGAVREKLSGKEKKSSESKSTSSTHKSTVVELKNNEEGTKKEGNPVAERISKYEDMSSEELKTEITALESSNPNSSILDIANQVKNKKELEELMPKGHLDTPEEVIQKQDEEENKEEEELNDDSHTELRSWVVTRYNINDLKFDKKATLFSSPIANALEDLGAYSFVDNGYLGDIILLNPNTPIYYIKSSDSVFKEVSLIAISEKDFIDTTPKDNLVIGSDGNKYLIIGVVGFNKKNLKSKHDSYTIFKTLNEQYDEWVQSTSKEEVASKYFVSSIKPNRVKHIYSGRRVTQMYGEEMPPHLRPLREVVGNTATLVVYYNKEEHPKLNNIVPINPESEEKMNGTVWFVSKGADGRNYYNGVKVKHFTEEDYDLNTHKDSPILQQIVNLIAELVKPYTQYTNFDLAYIKKYQAKYALEELLHFPSNERILFTKADNGDTVISITGSKDLENIGKGKSSEDKADEIILTLQSLNLQFQITPTALSSETVVKNILKSDILTTNLAIPGKINANFELYNVDDMGNPVYDVAEPNHLETPQPISTKKESSINISLNGIDYVIKDRKIYSNGEEITDENTKSELRLQYQINNGLVKPSYPRTKLYTGAYKDGKKFGIMNNTVIPEENLGKYLKEEKAPTPEEFKKTVEDKGTISFELASADDVDEILNGELVKTSTSIENDSIKEDKKDTSNSENNVPKAEAPKIDDTIDESKSAEELQNKEKTFRTLARKREMLLSIKSLGFNSVPEFAQYLNDPKNKLKKSTEITTEEELKETIDIIKKCRK